jgi:hypothetical protein
LPSEVNHRASVTPEDAPGIRALTVREPAVSLPAMGLPFIAQFHISS